MAEKLVRKRDQTVETPTRTTVNQPKARKKEADLPESPQIEQALLQVIFANPDQGFSAFSRSGRGSFFVNPVNRELYSLAKQFHADTGCLDWIAFTTHLQQVGRFAALGGQRSLTDLFVPSVTPPVDMLDYYIRELSDSYVRRRFIQRAFGQIKEAKAARSEEIPELFTSARHFLDDLEEAGISKLTLCDATNYLNGQCPPLPLEIVYHVLHEGSKMIVGGTSKGRKTMALIDLALSVATGTPWWGFNTRKGPICYINFEIQDGFFWYRVNEICQRKQIEPTARMFYAWNLRGRAEGIERLLEEILAELKKVPFVLIIIDPIYKALGARDENRAGDVASMLNEVEKIAVQTGAAVAFGAHYSKGNQAMKESIDRIGGSGVFARDPDSILTMTAHEEEECFTVEATLRNFPPIKPFVIKWEWPLFVRDDADPTRLKKARGGAGQFEAKFSSVVLLDRLSIIHGLTPKDAVTALKESHDISRRTVYRWKEELENKKLLIVRENQWYKANKEEQEKLCQGSTVA